MAYRPKAKPGAKRKATQQTAIADARVIAAGWVQDNFSGAWFHSDDSEKIANADPTFGVQVSYPEVKIFAHSRLIIDAGLA